MMELLFIAFWTLSALCFLVAVKRSRVEPASLDFVAFGLFFYIFPLVVDRIF